MLSCLLLPGVQTKREKAYAARQQWIANHETDAIYVWLGHGLHH